MPEAEVMNECKSMFLPSSCSVKTASVFYDFRETSAVMQQEAELFQLVAERSAEIGEVKVAAKSLWQNVFILSQG